MSSVHEEAIKMAQRHACFAKNARHIKKNTGNELSQAWQFQHSRHNDQNEHAGEALE